MVTKSEDIFGLEYTDSKNSLKTEALSKSKYAVLSYKCMTSGRVSRFYYMLDVFVTIIASKIFNQSHEDLATVIIQWNFLFVRNVFLFLIYRFERHGELVGSQQLLGYCRQTACGMQYLSGSGFIHRDLSARNILLSDGSKCKVGVRLGLGAEVRPCEEGGAGQAK